MLPSLQSLLIVSLSVFVGLSLGCTILFRALFLFITVNGRSMAPTLEPQDHVLVLRMWMARKIKKGDIVLLKHPASLSSSDAFFIKRVVAMEGDAYTEPGNGAPSLSLDGQQTRDETGRRCWHIPSGKVFVCGDHLAASHDSREWGPLPLSAIQGVLIHQFKRKAQVPVPESSFSLSFLTIGQEAPDFTVSDTGGAYLTLREMRGQRLLLLFTSYHQLAHKLLPTLLAQATSAARLGMTVLIICDEALERARLMQEDFSIPFPVLVAPKNATSVYHDYQVRGTPCYYLIDEKGHVAEAGIPNALSWRWD